MKKYAVIVAGGSGTRMGTTVPKQFLHLKGKPLLWYTLETFLKAYDDIEIILVIADDYLDIAKKILLSIPSTQPVSLVTGGQTRFHSVKNGLQKINEQSIVFVHDGVRCLLSSDLIHRCYAVAMEHGNAIPAIHPVDSIRIESHGGNRAINRNMIHIIQTPQTFQSDVLKAGYEQPYEDSFTDEASVVEKLGIKIHLLEGEETNIKITRPIDIFMAERILEEKNSM